MTSFDLSRLLLTVFGGFFFLAPLVYSLPRGSRSWHINRLLLVVTALASLHAYTRFGAYHDYGRYGRHTYHYHEIFHYFLGARYYPELGYSRLYDCSYVALKELESEGVAIPEITEIRSLKEILTSVPASQVAENMKAPCHEAFTPVRWKDLKADLIVFLQAGNETTWWRHMLFDHGLNPPPSWAVIAYPLASLIPPNHTTMDLFPYIDMGAIFLLCGYFILRAFGLNALCGFFIIFGNNWLSDYYWTGGSFYRQEWFVYLTLAICLLKQERFRAAGALMGISAAMRIFPVFFAVGAAIPLALAAWRYASRRRAFFDYALGGAVTFATLLILSVVVFGLERWHEFAYKISRHNSFLFVMHIGFDKLAVFSKDIGNQNFWWAPGLENFGKWNAMLRAKYAEHATWFSLIKALGIGSAIIAATRATPVAASILVGWSMLFFWQVPANYYYVFLALLPVVFYREPIEGEDFVRLVIAFVLIAALLILPTQSPDGIIHNGYINWAVCLALVGSVVATLVRAYRQRDCTGNR